MVINVHERRAARRPRAKAVAVPSTKLLADALPRVDWSDSYVVSCAEGDPMDPQDWADAIFHSPPSWVGGLMLARELLVGFVGIQRGGAAAFDTLDRTEDEVLLGIDQSHLGFRASVLRQPNQVVLSTVVQLHNRRGRVYFALVKRVHPAVVRAALTRAARRLAR